MIPLNFSYFRARTVFEAVHQFAGLARSGQHPLYYGGGTEIITFARFRQLWTDAVIDIKAIPAAQGISAQDNWLVIGAAVTLTQVASHPEITSTLPLLQATVKEIADRTARNKITLGGNLCGEIPYREAVLPLLVYESIVRIAGPKGRRELNVTQAFRRKMQLAPGEFIVQIVTDKSLGLAPFVHLKRRKMGQVGYPIVTAAALRWNSEIRVAFSGVCSFPFRSPAIETILNREEWTWKQRIEAAVQVIPPSLILEDFEASREYRVFVFRDVLGDILAALKG